jgi:hypothetical protein
MPLTKRLIECTIIALKLFIRLYNSGEISLETYQNHTQLKVKLLKDYIDKVGPEKSWQLQKVITIHESVLNSVHLPYSIQLS